MLANSKSALKQYPCTRLSPAGVVVDAHETRNLAQSVDPLETKLGTL